MASTALAADEGSATEAKARVARTECLAGNVEKGAAILAELFVETRDFTHIYNQGRCFEQNHRYEDALSRFREYLRKAPALSAEERRDAEEHVTECERLAQGRMAPLEGQPRQEAGEVQSTGQPPGAGLPSPFPAAPPAENGTLGAAPLTVVEPAPAPAEPRHRARWFRVAGIASGAVGLASLGTGVYFYTRARSLSDKVSDSAIPSPSDHKAGKNAETMQWVFYGVGAAAVACGGALYYFGWRSSAGDQPSVAFAPLAGPGLAGLSAEGAF